MFMLCKMLKGFSPGKGGFQVYPAVATDFIFISLSLSLSHTQTHTHAVSRSREQKEQCISVQHCHPLDLSDDAHAAVVSITNKQ